MARNKAGGHRRSQEAMSYAICISKCTVTAKVSVDSANVRNWATNPFPKFQILRDASALGMPGKWGKNNSYGEKIGTTPQPDGLIVRFFAPFDPPRNLREAIFGRPFVTSTECPGLFPWLFAVPGSNQQSFCRLQSARWTWNQIEIQNWRLGTWHWEMILQQTVDGCEILHHQTDGWNPIN